VLDGPAYRIETPRTLLRCWEPGDARALHETLLANLDHLRPWMEWARDEPQPFEARVRLVRQFRASFDADEDLSYAVLDPRGETLIGAVGLHARGDDVAVRHVGYWFARASCGQGLATEAVAALVRVAFQVHGLARVEIHCDADNLRSRALSKRLGFTLDAELRARTVRSGRGPTASCISSMLAQEVAESPIALASCTGFDVLGRVLCEFPDRPRGRSLLR
jgi:RimJ/RimL family protein N-acetyltransferase